ncbi:MAG: glycogen/starch synthase, partial [Smithellaceae bacterium]|nr:glycogen/starch synthase [Smithellaceae bacterium]
MPLVTFYFQLHQPFRLDPRRDRFLWESRNREIFQKVADKCYLPATEMFHKLIVAYPNFKITLGMSGTLLEQATHYRPEGIGALQKLIWAGRPGGQVECLDETYYHSLVSLFADPLKQEFRDQVSMHREMMQRLFDILPTSFRNTELMYNNEIAAVVADMGYASILCEKRDDMYVTPSGFVSPNAIFKDLSQRLCVLPRNREMSDDVAYRFPNQRISPKDYAANLAAVDGEAVVLGYDFEHIGEHIWEDKGIFDFWRELPAALESHNSVIMVTPTEMAERFRDCACPVADIHGLSTSSWADKGRNTFGWLGNTTQYELFKDIEDMEVEAKKAGGPLLTRWRHLTTSDHVYFLHEGMGEDNAVHSYFNPYDRSISYPTMILTRKIDDLQMVIMRFHILKRQEKTVILMITPETGRLPEDMGGLAKYISGKSGGQGEVVSALCEGLIERGYDVQLATLNLKRRFQKEAKIDEGQWREIRYRIDSGKIHLVSSSIFEDNLSAYAGDPLATAAEFQREIVNNTIKTVRAKSAGKLIIHSHDWMAGGAISAYARATGVPLLHTVHNVFTAYLPLDYLKGVNIRKMSKYVYFTDYNGRRSIDCQATAIKNANLINFVGEQFLKEVVEDYFQDRPLVPTSVRQEVKEKYFHDSARAIINAPSAQMYPEKSRHLVRRYGPNDDFMKAKEENRAAFQERMGLKVDPQAILFFWPSRLDPFQKGVELLEDVVQAFLKQNKDCQVAIVADGVANDRTHADILGGMAYSSKGRMTYQPFSDTLAMLGYAAASDVFGASLYEPCGQI